MDETQSPTGQHPARREYHLEVLPRLEKSFSIFHKDPRAQSEETNGTATRKMTATTINRVNRKGVLRGTEERKFCEINEKVISKWVSNLERMLHEVEQADQASNQR